MPGKEKFGHIHASLNSVMRKFDSTGMLHDLRGCVFITVGNTFRSDDGVGSYIGKKLSPHVEGSTLFHLLNAELAPENFIDTVIDFSPGFVIFIDAAQFDGKPGEIILLDENTGFPDYSLSTHTLPLNLITALIKTECPSSFYYIGIQAWKLEFGENLSFPVRKAAELLVNEIVQRI